MDYESEPQYKPCLCPKISSSLSIDLTVQEVVIVGGLEMQQQAKALAKRPHVVVATPGRLKVISESVMLLQLYVQQPPASAACLTVMHLPPLLNAWYCQISAKAY